MGILKKNAEPYFRLDSLDKTDALYRIAIGERSNGKTYACLERILENYCKKHKQGAYIRRWNEDFKRNRGKNIFSGLVANNLVVKYSNGVWNNVTYRNGAWYLSKFDDELNKEILDEDPFCYAFSLNEFEHDKSTSYPNITIIFFDEFLSRNGYLVDEWVIFMNVLSTIIRNRDNVIIYMMANTVAFTSPYFTEMGIKHINKMQKGTIDIYEYTNDDLNGRKLRVALEYAENLTSKGHGKASDIYFAFDSPALRMITHGDFELSNYPHCPCKYRPDDIRCTYFIVYDSNILECDIVYGDEYDFTFIHKRTYPIKDNDDRIVYMPEYIAKPNYSRLINNPRNKTEKLIWRYFLNDKVYYQDNECGEYIREYLDWCKKNVAL